jgi:hypothetical protein
MTGEKFSEALKLIDAASAADPDQLTRIVAKTARKMSPEDRAFAARLDLLAGLAPALEV